MGEPDRVAMCVDTLAALATRLRVFQLPVFVAAGLLALVIALATVSGHALLVARAKPIEALRYE